MFSPRMIFTISSMLLFGRCYALHIRRDTPFYNPTDNGGSWLDKANHTLGEPLNVVISAQSSPAVLTNDGIVNFARAIGFSTECVSAGAAQSANLGDGNGWVNQTILLREDYGNLVIGTCLEILIGGNHFRVFRQNGSLANSGALFLAVSEEKPLTQQHNITADGYDIGRNRLVSAAVGNTSFGDVSYSTTAEALTGLLAPGSTGVNHGISQDGVVVLLTVTIV